MPRPIYIANLSRNLEKPARVGYCDSFACRLRGLMFRPLLDPDDGLLLVEKRDSRLDTSIHMFFVPFDLAVFWINSDMTVVDKVIAKSWKPAYFPKADARYTLEIHPDRWADYEIGDRVEFKNA
ncbi:MAG: DUF192 domain-containing protein [Anaerolineales bacterium]|jgi:uncharacterized membrane protein (UPF0127 family)|nr:DUF192 domain-containing protein [Chloroflexota bacterium]MBK6646477.1 DUF192 domain-containing protein [Anaerolineales bacterium]MCC6986446.1 DUF192 domain-containing protein [Anaerolineales bacterium]